MPRNGFKKRFSSNSSSLNATEPSHASDDASDAPADMNANTATGAVVCQSDDEGNVIIEVSDACVCTPLAETFTNIPECSEVETVSATATATDTATVATTATDTATATVATVATVTEIESSQAVQITAAADIKVAPNSAPQKYGCFRSMWKCFKGACTLMCCCCCRRKNTATSSSNLEKVVG